MSAEHLLSRILACLDGVRGPDASGWFTARCPRPIAHRNGDEDPSLRLHEQGYKCMLPACELHQGGSLWRLARLLGIQGEALEGRRTGRQSEERCQQDDPLRWWAEHCAVPPDWLGRLPLKGRGGAVAFRWPGLETMKLRSPHCKGWWEPDGSPRPVLWPSLPQKAPPVLVLTEGESDATVALYMLETAGLRDRTTAAAVTKGASTRPDAALLRELAGKGVQALLLVPDADSAGEAWAQAWTSAARNTGLSVATLDLVALGVISPSLGEKDLRDAYRRHPQRVMAALKEAVGQAQDSILSRVERERDRIAFLAWHPVALGQVSEEAAVEWVWHGFIARGMSTDLYGLWKTGKSTLLGCLLREMAQGGELAGRPVARGLALVVSEEPAQKWARRCQELGLWEGAHDLIPRPFKKRATWEEWERFLDHLSALVRERGYSLVVLDALPNLWPVTDENDAGEVLRALRPLVGILEAGAGVLLVRHPRKSDGDEATAGRGSGAVSGFVDIIVEFRRYRPEDREDTRRVFSVYSREEPFEVVAEFDGATYTDLGSKAEVRRQDRLEAILSLLPPEPPGLTPEEVRQDWPEEPRPGLTAIKGDLAHLLSAGQVARAGDGRKGSPFRFYRPGPSGGPQNSILSGSTHIGDRIESGKAGDESAPFRGGDGEANPSGQLVSYARELLDELHGPAWPAALREAAICACREWGERGERSVRCPACKSLDVALVTEGEEAGLVLCLSCQQGWPLRWPPAGPGGGVHQEAPICLPFSKPHAEAILRGVKTQTSRKRKDPRLQKGSIVSARVARARAQVSHFADLEVVDVSRKRLGDFDEDDARREGGYTLEQFREVWRQLHGSWDPDEVVHVIQFRLLRVVDGDE